MQAVKQFDPRRRTAELSAADVRRMHRLARHGATLDGICSAFTGTTRHNIQKILRGARWREIWEEFNPGEELCP